MTPWWPLRPAQRGLFYGHLADPTATIWTTAEMVRCSGRLDPERLAGALTGAVAEFDGLRTRFRSTPDGPQQQILPPPPVRLEVVELADADAADRWWPTWLALDPLRGEVTRSALLRLATGQDWWFQATHHLVCDGFGFVQFARRVAELYRDDTPSGTPPPSVRDLPSPVESVDSRNFWAERLRTAVGDCSPAGRSAPAGPHPERARSVLDPALGDALAATVRRSGTSWPAWATTVLATAVAPLLADPPDLVRVGLPLMNRVHPVDGTRPAARTVCSAMNVVPLQVPSSASVREALTAVETELELLARHADLPQQELARRSPSGRLFGPQINVIPFDTVLDLDGIRGEIGNLTAGAVPDTTWTVRGLPGRGRRLRLEVDVNPALYRPGTAALFLQRLEHRLRTLSTLDPDTRLDDVDPLPPTERHQVLTGFNSTDRPHHPRTLGTALDEAVLEHPDRPALRFGDTGWSYRELDRAARAVAARVPTGGVVGVCLHRGPELYAAVHGIVRAGAAYLPLDPTAPAARIAGMLSDAGAVTVLATADTAAALPPGCRVVLLDTLQVTLDHLPAGDTGCPKNDLDSLAYVLFTSGSTGRPKGVAVSHRAIDNRLTWMQDLLPIGPGDVVLHKTPVTFDVSVWELFWPHLVGATVEIAEPDGHRDPRYLARTLRDSGVTTVHFVPSMLRRFLADARAVELVAGHRIRHLVCSGEAVDAALVDRARAVFGVDLVNLYGPTEAAVDITAWRCTETADDLVVPIGRPVPNSRTYVLDAQQRPRPIGVPGELYLAGIQLAEGYLGRPELTAAAFVPDPFRPGERMYRTGDVASWRPDGVLDYHGRTDHQVKLRGQRLELGEIEAVLAGVAEVAAAVRDDTLLVFAVRTAPHSDPVPALRAAAAAALPDGVRPDRYVVLDRLPLGSSGKVDRAALAALPVPGAAVVSQQAPSSVLEQEVARAMSSVLGDTVGPDDNFFTIGGHSLLALDLVDRIGRQWGIDLRFGDLFGAPTPATLAARIRQLQTGTGGAGGELDPVVVLRAGDPTLPPLVTLPPAGGLGWCWTALLPFLPPDQGVLAVQAEGLADGTPVDHPDLTALAERQLSLVTDRLGERPFHLIGWSIGGVQAHTVATLARRRGLDVGTVAVVDAYPGEQWRHLTPPEPGETLRAVLRMAGCEDAVPPDEVLTWDRTREVLIATGSALGRLPIGALRVSLHSVVSGARLLRAARHDRWDGDLLFFRAGAPRPEHWLDPAGWADHVTGQVQIHTLDAGHGELLRAPHVARIGEILAPRLGPVGPRPGALRPAHR